MTVSLYQASVPVYIHMLESLSAILDKAVAYAEAKKIEPAVLIQSRLAPDMRPLSFQVKMACFGSWNAVARVGGLEETPFEDDDTTFPQLKARLDKTLAFLRSVKPEQLDGQEARIIQLKMGNGGDTSFKAQPYLLHFAQPNFFFHVTTAYALLRHNGLELGKRDFIGKLVTE